MSERMWISEQLEQARTERDQARLELAAKDCEIAALIGERDRQYEHNVGQIVKQAELEGEIAALREAVERLLIEIEGPPPYATERRVAFARAALSASPAPDPAEARRAKPACPRDDHPDDACIWPRCVISCPGRLFPRIAALKGNGEGK